ncbi:hypothetical protein [Kitasatospora sp. NPDC005748]
MASRAAGRRGRRGVTTRQLGVVTLMRKTFDIAEELKNHNADEPRFEV